MADFQKYRYSKLSEEYGVKELNDEYEEDYTEPTNNTMTTNKVTIPKALPNEVESILNERLGDEYTAYYFYRYKKYCHSNIHHQLQG